MNLIQITKSLVLVFAIVNSSHSQDLLSLEEAIDLTLTNSFDIKLEKYNVEIAENNVSRAVSGQLPNLGYQLSYQYGYSNAEIETLNVAPGESNPPLELDGSAQTFSMTPEISIPIFSGFRNKYQFKQLVVKSDLSIQLLNKAIERAISNTVSTYLELARIQGQLKINLEIIEISNDRFKRVIEDAQYGSTNSLRKLQAEVDLKKDSSDFRNTLLMYENTRRNLNFLMAQPSEREYVVEQEIALAEKLSYNDLKTELFQKNSDLQISILSRENSTYQAKIAKSSLSPTLSGYANYSFLDTQNDAAFLQSQKVSGPNVGLRMSWTIYNGGANKINIKNAKIGLQQQQVTLQKVQTEIEKELQNAYSQYENNQQQLRIEKANLNTFQLNFEKTSQDFKLGIVAASDVRIAQLNLSSAKNRINNLTYSVKQSEIKLLELTGRLQLYSIDK
ncbi:MAG: TolC family protein [bacterium]|nr:TolC family protein [bacterium]